MEIFDEDAAGRMLAQLARLTKERILRWKFTDRYEYVARAEPYVFSIYSEDRDGVAPFVLRLSKVGGEEVDSFSQTDVSPELNAMIYELYDLAKRSSLGADDVVQDVFRALDNIPPF